MTAPAEELYPAFDYEEPCLLPKRWREEVEAHTRNHRAKKARKHWTEAFGASEWSTAVWHVRRARGQEKRFTKLANCGQTFEAGAQCKQCDETMVKPVHCGLVNLCPRCRGRQAQKLRTRVDKVMKTLPEGYGDLKRRWRQPWGWKLLTLTVPHGAVERARLRERGDALSGVERDTSDLAKRIWPVFWRWVKEHLRLDRGEEHTPLFVKCLEITVTEERAGRQIDEQAIGHAHYHVAVFVPYLHKSIVNLLWGKALARAGRRCPSATVADILSGTVPGSTPVHEYYREEVTRCFRTRRGECGEDLALSDESWQPAPGCIPWAVTDIREADGDVSQELVKYLVKDVTITDGKTPTRVPSLKFARAYRAVDGRRRLSSSAAIKMPDPESCRCEACESEELAWSVQGLGEPDSPALIRVEPMTDLIRRIEQRELVAEYRKWQRERRVYQQELTL